MSNGNKTKIAKRAGCCFAALLLSPLLLVFSVIILLYTPFDMLRFRLSAYRRDTKHKYIWLITTAPTYRLYRIISSEGYAIKYEKKKDTNAAFGYFTAGDCLLFYDLGAGSAYFDEEDGEWHAFYDGQDMLISHILNNELDAYAEEYGRRPSKAVALYNRTKFETDELEERAAESDLFLLHGKRALHEALEAFAKENALSLDTN